LKFIAIGESDEQNVIEIDFGIEMVPVYTEHDLLVDLPMKLFTDVCQLQIANANKYIFVLDLTSQQ
jgi:hypothetical protein